MKYFVVGVLLAAAPLSSTGCKSDAPSKANAEIPAVPVETQELATRDFTERVEVSGVAEPIFEMRVAAEAPGRILTAPFEEGETVKKGQLLIRVDAQLDSARIDLLKSQVSSARREFERTKMLASEGLATPQQLDQAQSSVESAKLSLKQARVGRGKTTVRSPQTGIVARKYVEEGEYAAPGAPLAHLVDYSTIVIEAAVPESDVAFVTKGAEVGVWIPALRKKVTGVVERRAIVATAKTRTFPVEIHVDNGDLEILPGMRARVIIPRKTWKNVLVVPRDAILQGFENKEAMVLPGDDQVGKAELRTVDLGPARGNEVVVTSGLAAGERLIVKGHRSIVNGTKVKAVKQYPAEPTGETASASSRETAAEIAQTPEKGSSTD
jgi:RND family efflux transporter MFP subunit